mmetsp:Transcript_6942/g.13030  ORF Transcript_6942/g.13030 Transcript_6942/m.13030 type:complete len:100 (-) Transcript_6942:49-348(-)
MVRKLKVVVARMLARSMLHVCLLQVMMLLMMLLMMMRMMVHMLMRKSGMSMLHLHLHLVLLHVLHALRGVHLAGLELSNILRLLLLETNRNVRVKLHCS